jgi:hypothetical protein
MAQWMKFDKFELTQMRGGAIFKTVQKESHWFEVGTCPRTKFTKVGDFKWFPTCEMKFGEDPNE